MRFLPHPRLPVQKQILELLEAEHNMTFHGLSALWYGNPTHTDQQIRPSGKSKSDA